MFNQSENPINRLCQGRRPYLMAVAIVLFVGILSSESIAQTDTHQVASSKVAGTSSVDQSLAVPKRSSDAKSEIENKSGNLFEIGSTGMKIGIVVGIILLFLLLATKKQEKKKSVPREALELLGRVPFSARQSLQLVRFGRKIVLVEASSNGLRPISEITDPLEVQQLLEQVRPS